MRMRVAASVAVLAVAVAACTDQPLPITPSAVPGPASPSFAISDGAHSGGNPDFFFLPPLVANPVSNPNFKPGTFNPHLQPVVRVFLLPTAGAAGCGLLGTPVFGPVAATLDAGGEQYQVNWDTRASNLADGAYYRLCVFSSPTGQELGFLDVAPVAGGMKKLATNDTYAFQDGRTLPIKVRIQQGALCANPQDCTEFTVTTAGGDFTLPSGFAGLSVPAGAVRSGDIVTVVIEKETPQFTGECLPTDIVQSKGCYHFSSEPALYQFASLVRMEACVDAQFLGEGQLAALRLFKFNTTQGLVELPQATPTLIDCTNFVALANPTASSRASFAAAALRGLGRWAGRLLAPPPLYASMPGGVPVGLGGLGGSFSDVGGAVPSTATQAPVLLTVPASATVGQTGLSATASGGSGTGAMTFASSTRPVCTVDATSGSITTLTAGTCSLTATKAADEIYSAATSAPGSFTVAGLPDLVVSSLNLQTTAVNPGGLITYTYTISNIGGEGPTGISTFDVAGYLSSDAVLDAGDLELGGGYSVWTYHLTAGWSQSRTESDVVIPNTVPPGSYYLIVVADAKPGLPPNFYPGVSEANESNNWRAIPIRVISP